MEGKKMRPHKISMDIRFMERRKRVTELLGLKCFVEKMEQICQRQIDESNRGMPINDIRCEDETLTDLTDEKQLRCNLAALFRLHDLHGWTHGVGGQISARLNHDQGHFLVNPYGLLYNEITASNLVKVNTQGEVVDQGTTNFGIHLAEFQLHSTIYAARPDITCVIHIITPPVTAVSSLKCGLLPVCDESIVIGDVSTHMFLGDSPMQKVTLLTNRGAFCCGETIEEAFFNCSYTVFACETQVALMPMGIENIHLVSEEDKKAIFEASQKSTASPVNVVSNSSSLDKRWKIGQAEFEALLRVVDNSGFQTGYNCRKPLLKSGHKEYNQQFLLTTPNVPKSTNPIEFKQLNQQIKDDCIAGKISAEPQSRILKEISCDEAKTLQDPTSSHSSLIKSISQSLLPVSSKTEEARQNGECLLQIEKEKLPEPNEPVVVLCDDILTNKEETEREKMSADLNAIARHKSLSESSCAPIFQQTKKFLSDDKLKAPEHENLIKDTTEELDKDSSNEVENLESVISAKSVNNEEVDDDKLNDSSGTIETSFQNDVNDSRPGRSSSPITKNHQHDEKIHEVINNQNVDLTPAEKNSPHKLCETENPLNYIPDSIQNQEDIKVLINRDRVYCQSCAHVVTTNNLALDYKSNQNDELKCFVDEIDATNDRNTAKNNNTFLNQIIELLDNSTDIEALREKESLTDFVVGSDLLETPNSVVVKLQKSNDLSFHQDIATSANEIIASIGECDRIVEAEQSIDQVNTDQFFDLPTKADEAHAECEESNDQEFHRDIINDVADDDFIIKVKLLIGYSNEIIANNNKLIMGLRNILSSSGLEDSDQEVKSAEQPLNNDIHKFPRDKLQPNKNKSNAKKNAIQRANDVLSGDSKNAKEIVNTKRYELELQKPKIKKKKGKKKNQR